MSGQYPNHNVLFKTDFKPIVLREKEIVTKTVHITEPTTPGPTWVQPYVQRLSDMRFTYDLEEELNRNEPIELKICVQAELATPANPVSIISEVAILNYSNYYSDENTKVIEGERALLNNVSTVFSRF